MTIIKELAIALGLDVGDTPEKLDELDDKSEAAAESLGSKLGGAAVTAGKGLLGLAAGASAAAIGIFKLVEGSAAAGAAVDDASKRAGVTAREWQRLGYAAEQAGAGPELLAEGLKTLDVQLAMVARTGTGPAAEALKAVGLQLEDIQGLGAEDKMAAIADAIAGVEDPGTRTAAAIGLLGGAGQKLVPLLAEGGAALRGMGDEAERLGLVMSDEAIASAAELDDTLAKVNRQIAQVATDVGLALAPAVQDLAGELSTWVNENRELVASGIDGFLEDIVPLLVETAKGTLDVVGAISDLVDDAGGAENALMIIAGGYTAVKVAALGIPGAMVVAGAAIGFFAAEAISELSGVNAEIRRLDSQLDAGRTATRQGERGIKAIEDLDKMSQKDIGKLSDEEYARRLEVAETGINAAASAAGNDGTALVFALREKYGRQREFGKKLIANEASFDAAGRAQRHQAELRKLEKATAGSAKPPKGGGGGKKAKAAAEDKMTAAEAFDPILSDILGVDISAVSSRSAIASTGMQPQTLINTVHNAFAFDIDIAVNGARAPDEVSSSIGASIKDYFDAKIEETARTLETRIHT